MFGESCCVLDFGDFCSWKHNFGVGKYGVRLAGQVANQLIVCGKNSERFNFLGCHKHDKCQTLHDGSPL